MKLALTSKIGLSLISGLMASSLAVAGWFAAPAAYAATGASAPASIKTEALENAFQAELKETANLQGAVDNAKDAVAMFESKISPALKSKKVDASALDAAVDALRAQIIRAQAAHDMASDILSKHAGFDADGHVLDAALAQKTLDDAEHAMSAARDALKDAMQSFHTAVDNLRTDAVADKKSDAAADKKAGAAADKKSDAVADKKSDAAADKKAAAAHAAAAKKH